MRAHARALFADLQILFLASSYFFFFNFLRTFIISQALWVNMLDVRALKHILLSHDSVTTEPAWHL